MPAAYSLDFTLYLFFFFLLSTRLTFSITNTLVTGIKEYSEWPTIPQLYVDKEFIGGCDILMTMHQDGSLAKMLEEKGVLVPAEDDSAEPPK